MLNCIEMNWQEFISQIMREFRLSENELAKVCNTNQPTINRISRGETEKPFPSTIKKIEEGLQIKIDDSNPDQVTYTRLPHVVNERKESYNSITQDELEIVQKLREMGINSPDDFDRFLAGLGEIPEQIKDSIERILKHRFIKPKGM